MKDHDCFILSQCDNSSNMKMWGWKDLHMNWTLSCLDYIICIPEINPIPASAHVPGLLNTELKRAEKVGGENKRRKTRQKWWLVNSDVD